MRGTLLGIALFGLVLIGAAYWYARDAAPERANDGRERIGTANPASVYCVDSGGTLEIVGDDSGAQAGYCHLPDGRVCEEWALYRSGSCAAPTAQ